MGRLENFEKYMDAIVEGKEKVEFPLRVGSDLLDERKGDRMKFPTYKEMGEKVAEQALDEYVINGKTLREWIKLLSEQEPCDDFVSRQAVLDLAYDMSEIDGEHFSEPCMVVDVEDILKLLPSRRSPKQ